MLPLAARLYTVIEWPRAFATSTSSFAVSTAMPPGPASPVAVPLMDRRG